ncbi:hypothetical protein DVH24_007843 [Malus domestica]|uniref:Uncharacterized protein n=1 Tax=Malus domestica TaxID=3750 RepID=A0A498JRF7_MALDO|nr:hypothetical protein DVH24_007843 [Malus domestica]
MAYSPPKTEQLEASVDFMSNKGEILAFDQNVNVTRIHNKKRENETIINVRGREQHVVATTCSGQPYENFEGSISINVNFLGIVFDLVGTPSQRSSRLVMKYGKASLGRLTPPFPIKTQAEFVLGCAELHNLLRKECRSDEFPIELEDDKYEDEENDDEPSNHTQEQQTTD